MSLPRLIDLWTVGWPLGERGRYENFIHLNVYKLYFLFKNFNFLLNVSPVGNAHITRNIITELLFSN
jgi:hypothetical protein